MLMSSAELLTPIMILGHKTICMTLRYADLSPSYHDVDKTLEWFKNKPFTRAEIARAWDAGKAEGNDVTTVWGMVQGLTAYARKMPYTNWLVNLERRAGALLGN